MVAWCGACASAIEIWRRYGVTRMPHSRRRSSTVAAQDMFGAPRSGARLDNTLSAGADVRGASPGRRTPTGVRVGSAREGTLRLRDPEMIQDEARGRTASSLQQRPDRPEQE